MKSYPRLILHADRWRLNNPQHGDCPQLCCEHEHRWMYRPIKIWQTTPDRFVAVITEPSGAQGMSVANAPQHYLQEIRRAALGSRFAKPIVLVEHTPHTPPVHYSLWNGTHWRYLSTNDLLLLIGFAAHRLTDIAATPDAA